MSLKCVPLLKGMFGAENSLDLKAVYRRRKQTNWGEPILDEQGREQWDLCPGLPLRRHMDYLGRGYQYITLADEQSLIDAKHVLAANNLDWREFANQEPRSRSPFNPDLYVAEAKASVDKTESELQAMVDQYGYDAVLAIKRQADPGFQMPASVKKPKAKKAEAVPA